jgi:hypothetical protein
MKIKQNVIISLWLWSLVMLLVMPTGEIMAQGQEAEDQMPFRQEELDQMLAPIALYPDDLLSEALMAATYPLEVVEAARWIQANPDLRGDQLAAALEQKDWDPSVKSLVNFPSVLQMMSEKLEWTEMLGDAFLAGEDQVMDTVQKLRQKAQAQGNLRTSSEQRVSSDPQTQTIIIESADPQVVYVPVYDPMVVYGPWWWPAYPPFKYYPRGGIIPGRLIGFGSGVPIGVAWGYAWGGCDWHQHKVVVNISRNVSLNKRIDRNRYTLNLTRDKSGRGVWVHDPNHRRGISYRTPAIAKQFGRGPLPGVDARRSFRGYDRPAVGGAIPQGINRPTPQQTQGYPRSSSIAPEPVGPATPIPQSRITSSQRITRPEPPRQLPTPGQQPRAIPGPRLARPEGFRPPSAPVPQRAQGLQGPTAFSGFDPGSQTREVSHRGHESLSGRRAGQERPEGGRPGQGGGHPGGENPKVRNK